MHLPFEAYRGPEPYVFVSYAHKDSPSVFSDMKWLNDRGYRVWYDEGIDPGHDWPEYIARALDNCLVFLVFISPRAVESHNVRNEINFAINRRKPFIAIHVEQTKLPMGLELQLGPIQAINKYAISEDLYRRRIERALPATILQVQPELASDQTAADILKPANSTPRPTPIAVAPPSSRFLKEQKKVQPTTLPSLKRALGQETRDLSVVWRAKRVLEQETRTKGKSISEIMALINYPAQQLVNVVLAVPRDIVIVVSKTAGHILA